MSVMLRVKDTSKNDIEKIDKEDVKTYTESSLVPFEDADYYFVRIPHRHFDACKIYAVCGDVPQIFVWDDENSRWFPVILYQRDRRFLETQLLGRVLNDE